MRIKTLNTSQANFNSKLSQFVSFKQANSYLIEQDVQKILDYVERNGDNGLRKFIKQYDKTSYKKISDSLVTKKEINTAYSSVTKKTLSSLKQAMRNIKKFSNNQKLRSWNINIKGSKIGEKVVPIENVGIYVPGGKASYPSTVLMNAIPAKIAGVKNIVMTCPPNKGKLNPLVLVAADLCGVDKIFKFGGAHAIAALAFGTETIKAVDKIVGPGNIYFATAKK